MTKVALFSMTLAVFLVALLPAAPGQANPRTFVSGIGTDAGDCPRAAPCLTLAYAHGQTDEGGELTCIDSGNFDRLSISKSITIDCGGTIGGIDSGANPAIIISGTSIIVQLRNLTLDGGSLGLVGVRFTNGAALFVENCVIANFNGGVAGFGIGIKFEPPTGITAKLEIKDSIISNNGRPADGGGIIIQPAGTGSARVVIENTRVLNNTYGIFANGTGSTGGISVQVRDSVAAGNVFNGISAYTNAGASVTSITVDRSSSLLNGQIGILAQGAGAYVTLGESTVISNTTGLSVASGGNIFSYQNNQLTGNVADGAPTAVLTVK